VDHPSVIPPRGRALEDAERAALLADLTEIVASSHLFKSLGEEGRLRLIETGYVIRFDAGEPIIREGDEGSTMFLVMQGRVRVETAGARASVQLAELGRGACIGEVSVLTGSPRTATVTALEAVQVVAFEKHRISRIVDDYPRVRQLLETMIEGRARDTVEKIIGS
jgi:CRP/FNR family transcriptional regulator, cyclic AMP receptor protein